MSRKSLLALALTAALVPAATACSSGGDAQPSATAGTTAPTSGATTPAAPSSSKAPTKGTLEEVKADFSGKVPQVTLPTTPWTTTAGKRVIEAGTGDAITAKHVVTWNYVLVNARDGKVVLTTFDKDPITTSLSSAKEFPAQLRDAMVGQKVGTKLVLAAPATDLVGPEGSPQDGIEPKDTVILAMRLDKAELPLAEATGKPMPADPNLPKATFHANKPATFEIPAGPAPTTLQSSVLIQGAGAPVKDGQQLTVHYTGVIWGSGKVFDSSKNPGRGEPATFQFAPGMLIPGWTKGLAGKAVGSRVLLVVPPADGYGPKGSPSAGIGGTDTLVFLVDILAAS